MKTTVNEESVELTVQEIPDLGQADTKFGGIKHVAPQQPGTVV